MMVGPAGSGKNLIAEHIAVELGRPFYFNGPLQSEYKLTGYKDANGRYHYTPFRQAFEHGGVYLFDEFDACSAQALVAFNTALSNRVCDFPDRVVHQHPDFICLAAANTYGHGGTATYAGRERIDGATLDRFVVVDIQYDEKLELMEAANEFWVLRVQKLRRAANTIERRHIISMRASIEGARLLAKKIPLAEVEAAVIWRGLPVQTVEEIKKAAGVR
jgi:MoxR-like ATPase